MKTNTTTVTTPSSQRTTSLAAGILYLLTFVSIPTLALYDPVKGANYIIGSGSDTAAISGGILEIIVALAGIGTAVVLFPVPRSRMKVSRWASLPPEFWYPAPSSSAWRFACRS